MQTSFIKHPSRALKIGTKIGKAAAFKKPNVTLSTLPDNRNFYLTGEELYLRKLFFIFVHNNRFIDILLSTTELFPSAPIKSATVIDVRLEKSSTVSTALLTTSRIVEILMFYLLYWERLIHLFLLPLLRNLLYYLLLVLDWLWYLFQLESLVD